MTARLKMRIGLLCLTSLGAFPVQAEDKVVSRYSTAGQKLPQCALAKPPVEGMSCTGLAGWTLNIGYPAFGATINFSQGKALSVHHSPRDGKQVDVDDLAGKTTTIEWRGMMRGATFEPHAAIIRVLVQDAAQRQGMIEQGARLPAAKHAQILIVTRLGGEGSCQIAYVDAQANAKPNEMARRAADALGRSTTCPVSSVEIVGAKTPILASYMK